MAAKKQTKKLQMIANNRPNRTRRKRRKDESEVRAQRA